MRKWSLFTLKRNKTPLKHHLIHFKGNKTSLKHHLIHLEGNKTPLEHHLIHLEGHKTPLEHHLIHLEGHKIPLEHYLINLEGNKTPLWHHLITLQQNLMTLKRNPTTLMENLVTLQQNLMTLKRNLDLYGKSIISYLTIKNTMIYSSLHTITNLLNNYLVDKFQLKGQQAAVLASVLSQDGSIPEHVLNRITLTLVRLEQDKNKINSSTTMKTPAGAGGFNHLYILFTAVFEDAHYDEGLKFLEETLIFLEKYPVLNSSNTPNLDSTITQIRITPVESGLEDTSTLWATIGAKYRPSVLYLVRVESKTV